MFGFGIILDLCLWGGCWWLLEWVNDNAVSYSRLGKEWGLGGVLAESVSG